MKLSWAILCQDVTSEGAGGAVDILGAGVATTIAPDEPPPWGMPICIATCVVAGYDELQEDSDHVFRFAVSDSAAGPVFSGREVVRYFAGGGYKDFPHTDIQGWKLEPIIMGPGDYTIEVVFDRQTPVTLLYRVFSL
ncbi:MAG TPA: hypothetical protein VG318_15165 [Actinomycetota bacterium]|nr:hypothetical protein [Actinomycetota bacterium]